jgi:hypothetical protein
MLIIACFTAVDFLGFSLNTAWEYRAGTGLGVAAWLIGLLLFFEVFYRWLKGVTFNLVPYIVTRNIATFLYTVLTIIVRFGLQTRASAAAASSFDKTCWAGFVFLLVWRGLSTHHCTPARPHPRTPATHSVG